MCMDVAELSGIPSDFAYIAELDYIPVSNPNTLTEGTYWFPLHAAQPPRNAIEQAIVEISQNAAVRATVPVEEMSGVEWWWQQQDVPGEDPKEHHTDCNIEIKPDGSTCIKHPNISSAGSPSAAAEAPAAKEEEEPPADFICPITTEIMVEPVVAADGQSYERTAIERWLATKSTSPLTGGELERSILNPEPQFAPDDSRVAGGADGTLSPQRGEEWRLAQGGQAKGPRRARTHGAGVVLDYDDRMYDGGAEYLSAVAPARVFPKCFLYNHV
ncbi:hypothetical protein EMIHUDRAFT_220477 [Emiliania huxleyi CCMP1516]|uniref:U-box domain-containing protein n=2 Tax=Emiliania huxleyi TaxID=2903 RepID=A0A0D3I164_EMIH1|nr:hypothetical protein EMIHUDRAFT_220477 [Emiliania huxleyi CCMP1516]EOD04999.1 hypothetical protein EMIHUDRAFT_220477 [Emiliania huxleyi CCMP1516]|eukprot:XP_005757428.1 hypothetical protein EMIHUDRAFT_220477 [Emiliania huxleyi CCMP1516]